MPPPGSSAPLRVGTRGSPLALAQAELALRAMREVCPGLRAELVRITTAGDRAPDRPFAEIGPKGVFAAELQRALLRGEVDVAVHSLKDLPAEEPGGLEVAAVLPRGEVRDALVSREGVALGALAPGARLGTSSLRRSCLLRAARPDLTVVPLRGNVDTRLEKVARGEVEAAVLAGAGVVRLGRAEAVAEWLDPRWFVPAPGQGAVAVEVRRERLAGDLGWLAELDDSPTRAAVEAERELMRELEGGCRVPLGAWARWEGEELALEAFVGLPDGSVVVRGSMRGRAGSGVGVALARELYAQGAGQVLARLRG